MVLIVSKMFGFGMVLGIMMLDFMEVWVLVWLWNVSVVFRLLI